MKEFTLLGKAISDPTRARLLRLLVEADLCVCEMMDAMEVGNSTVSTHLQVLRSCGVVQTEKRRAWVIYSLGPQSRTAIETLLQHLPLTGERAERDIDRLSQRMLLRIDGCCVVGAGVLDREASIA